MTAEASPAPEGYDLARRVAIAAIAAVKAARMAHKSEAEAERRATEAALPLVQEAMRDGAYRAACVYAETTKSVEPEVISPAS